MVRAICIGIARQVARKITHDCNSAISLLPHKHHARNLFFIAIAFAVSLRDRGPVSNVCAAVVLSWPGLEHGHSMIVVPQDYLVSDVQFN